MIEKWMRVATRGMVLACLVLSACGGESGDSAASAGGPGGAAGPSPQIDNAALVLPIEVLGNGAPDAPTIAVANLTLDADAIAQATRLTVRCHRCGFYNSPEFETLSKPLTKVAASLRIAGARDAANAPWIDITDANITMPDAERAHGGVNGAQVAIRFSIPIDGAARSRLTASTGNRIEFRFNGTDGNSNGFRILDVQLQDNSGRDLLSMPKRWKDIAAEKVTTAYTVSDAQAGSALWHGGNVLRKSPIVARTLRAACASCHASDGRDLQYFNYSNNSIVQRARFHGLSTEQGNQIVAYLRTSLASSVPHVAQAAPWNPPYQPGPGLDSRPVAEWAAGAGLDAVLPDAASFLNAFTGKPAGSAAAVTQSDLDAAMDPSPGKVLNTREMPIPLELPDWNAWLPIESPLDIWAPEAGQSAGLFETRGVPDQNPQQVFQRIDDWLKANRNPAGGYGDWSHLSTPQRERAQAWLGDLGARTIEFGGGGRGSHLSPDPSQPYGGEIGGRILQARMSAQTAGLANLPAAFTREAFVERAQFGVMHWMGVRQWELAHRHGLEGPQAWLHGSRDGNGAWVGQGERRGWPFSWPSVFYVAPHMLYVQQGGRENYFSWEPRLVSFYRTNQWYQLQMTINPGWPGASVGPMDWPYHMGFITGLADDLITAKAPGPVTSMHLVRFFEVRTKLAQLANTNLPFDAPDPNDPNNLFRNGGLQSRADLANHKLGVGEVVDRGPDTWEKSRFRELETVTPGLHLKFINSSISLYNKMYADTTYAQWRRCDPNARFGDEIESKSGFRFCLDPQRTPLPLNSKGQPHLVGGWVDWTTQQYTLWSVMSARNHGAEPARLKVFSDWVDRMWPN